MAAVTESLLFRLRLGLSAAAAIALLSACGAPAAAPATGGQEGSTGPSGALDVAVASDIISGDFHVAQGGGNWPMSVFVPEGLTGADSTTGKLRPRLATEWTALDNGKVWEFKLRKGVEFHNGEPLNGEAVRYSFDRLVDPEIKAGRRASIAPLYEKTEIVDENTVRFVLKKADTTVPSLFGGQPIFPPKYAKEAGPEQFSRQPVGTGPFRMVERRPGELVELEAFEKYWNSDPKVGPSLSRIKTVKQRIIPEDQTRIAALQTREVAAIVNVPESAIKRLESTRDLKIQYRSADALNYLLINSMAETDPQTGKPNPLRDRRVRQAINHAVDVDAITRKLRTGKEKRSVGETPASLGYDPTLKPYAYDPPKAKALLAEAGYADGFETAIYDPTGRWPASKEVNEAVAGYLNAVGIKATVQAAEYAVVARNLVEKKLYGMAFWGGGHGADPITSITLFFRKGEKAVRGEYIGHPEIEELIDRFLLEFDVEKQSTLMKRMNRLYFEDAADLFLYDQWYVFGYDSTKVQWDAEGPPFSSNSGQIPYWELIPVKR